MRKLRNKLPNVKPLVTKIREGGTGAVSASQALTNLNAVPASLIDKPGGVLSLDVNRKLKPEVIAGLSVTGTSIDGPTSMTINEVQAFTITDYDAFLSYNLTAIGGSVSRSGDTITYTAPASAGSAGFIINGKTISVAVGANIVMSPTINNILNGSTNIGQTISLDTTAFIVSSGSDTHQWSDWQIATDINFTAIVTQSLSDTVNKTSWLSGDLQPNTTYYARVRHKGNAYGYSNWSSILTFTTKITFTPSTETAKVVYTSEAYAYFGYSVAVDDDGTRIVVGAPYKTVSGSNNNGIVYVYVKSGTSWILEATITQTPLNSSTYFGWSVDIDATGTRIAIGTKNNPSGGGYSDSGVVFIFTRSDSSWAQEAKLEASDVESGKHFGYSVSIDSAGDRVVVGASKSTSTGGVKGGAAYIFLRTGVSWAQEAKIIASDYTSNWSFGYSVAIDDSGVRVIIGSFSRMVSGSNSVGSAYIFLRSGVSWAEEAILTPEAGNVALTINMGHSVSIDSAGDRVVVGAPGSNSNKGYIFIFKRTGVSWAQEVIFTNVVTTNAPMYGQSVSMSDLGDTVIVGAPNYKNNSNLITGAVFAHTRSGVSWDTKDIILGSGTTNDNLFGSSVDISNQGNVFAAGAPRYDGGSYVDTGALFLFA